MVASIPAMSLNKTDVKLAICYDGDMFPRVKQFEGRTP
jgi:hypothetical protein